jgi:hypothetical protein
VSARSLVQDSGAPAWLSTAARDFQRSQAGSCAAITPLSRLANVSQQPSPGARTIVDERTQERPDYRVDEGDHERFSHYVPKDKLTEAMVMGTPVVALCGKVWVPSRDPERFPVCPECKEIWESLEPGGDEN